ncbi:MAG: Spi family protease inhibitor, partial [Bacteroidales bacterium]|nr:Spi family protease inhibitor [Bacteroidales bacterium]
MTLQAGPVSADRALEVAKKALPQPATKASGDLKLIWNGENAATKAAGQPAFYVFGRDAGGFVIIAGDDNVQPVLAISETNEF